MEEMPVLVLLGNVVGPRRDKDGVAGWLTNLAAELDEAYASERVTAFSVDGDQILGILGPAADPVPAVLRAALAAAKPRQLRWVAVQGAVIGNEGQGIERAREAMKEAAVAHERFVIRTGEAEADALLSMLTPVLADLLEGLTVRQREVARLALVDGLRQSGVAEKLGIRRATVSVSFGRARVGSMARLIAAIRRVRSSAHVEPPAAVPGSV